MQKRFHTVDDVIEFYDEYFYDLLERVSARLVHGEVREWIRQEGIRRIKENASDIELDAWNNHGNTDLLLKDTLEELADAIVYESMNVLNGNLIIWELPQE